MMKKKLTAMILAMSVTAATTASLPANAIFHWGNQNSPDYLENTFNGNALDEKYYPLYDRGSYAFYDEVLGYFISPNGNSVVAVHPLENLLVCKTALGYSNAEELAELYAHLGKVNERLEEHFGEGISIDLFVDDMHVYNAGNYPIKEIVSFLKAEEVFYDFEYQTDRVYFTHISSPYVTTYSDGLGVGERTQKVIDYVTENVPEADVTFFNNYREPLETAEGADSVTILLKNDDSLTAHLDLALEIYEATGISPFGLIPSAKSDEIGVPVDVENYIDGDANCDGQLTIADAATVLQALGNSDKYELSAQGEFNADLTGDGLTILDALSIQKQVIMK